MNTMKYILQMSILIFLLLTNAQGDQSILEKSLGVNVGDEFTYNVKCDRNETAFYICKLKSDTVSMLIHEINEDTISIKLSSSNGDEEYMYYSTPDSFGYLVIYADWDYWAIHTPIYEGWGEGNKTYSYENNDETFIFKKDIYNVYILNYSITIGILNSYQKLQFEYDKNSGVIIHYNYSMGREYRNGSIYKNSYSFDLISSNLSQIPGIKGWTLFITFVILISYKQRRKKINI